MKKVKDCLRISLRDNLKFKVLDSSLTFAYLASG